MRFQILNIPDQVMYSGQLLEVHILPIHRQQLVVWNNQA
jgi:hypothetical protein